MQLREILFPFTGSNEESDMLILICKLARSAKANVTVLQVVEVPLCLPEDCPGSSLPRLEEARQILECADLISRKQGMQISTEVVQAREVGPGIVRVAESIPSDLIVLAGVRSTHHPDQPIGETIGYLLRHAPCPVWVGCQPSPNGYRQREG
ncbi:MAG: universal stress protein [Candidatus Eremiobacterota bacterium]